LLANVDGLRSGRSPGPTSFSLIAWDLIASRWIRQAGDLWCEAAVHLGLTGATPRRRVGALCTGREEGEP
jgi:hypothetical protein